MKSDFMEDAACSGLPLEWWFPDQDGPGLSAYKVCGGCPVASECLAFALECNVKYGIWGGANFTNKTKALRKQASRDL